MASSSPSRFSTVAVFSTSVIAAATVSGYVAYFNGNTYQAGTHEVTTASGATVTAGGGAFQATNLGNAACRKSTNGLYYDCYQETFATATGGCVSGGCSTRSYNVASITKPFTGSGTIQRVQYDCRTNGISRATTIGTVSATTASGNDLINRVAVNSGATTVTNDSGTTVWGNVKPIIKVSTPGSIQTNQCILRVWSNGNYQ